MVTSKEDPVIHELTTTLREWHKIWQSLYLDNQTDLFDKIGNLLASLIDSRLELINLLKQGEKLRGQARGEQQIVELKVDVVNKLDLGNRLLNLDLVPRNPKTLELVDPVESSPVKLYQLHSEAASNPTINYCSILLNGSSQDLYMSSGSTLSTHSQASYDAGIYSSNYNHQSSCNLQMSLKSHHLAAVPPDELVEVYFSIVEISCNNNYGSSNSISSQNRPITDKFLVQIQNDELVCGRRNTIFTNLGSLQNRDICLFIQVYRVGRMTLNDGHKTTFGRQLGNQQTSLDSSSTSLASLNKYTSNGPLRLKNLSSLSPTGGYRRPFGSNLIPLRDLIKNVNSKESLMNLKIVATSESEFSQLPEHTLKRNLTIKTNQNLPYISLDISMRFLMCPERMLSQYFSLENFCLTEKRGFPDIVMPGDFKNDLYLTLESAEFEKGGKSISKNIEASISLVNETGLVIPDCISPGSNCDNVSYHKSCVFYHSNSPKWNECIKIIVPLPEFDKAHIRIEFRHCSTKEKEKKFIGFAYLPLSDDDGAIIADKSHDLYLYKCDTQSWADESISLCKYTSLPYGPAAKPNQNLRSGPYSNFTHSSREIVTVSTFLLSTKLTQNSNLLKLLKWRELIDSDRGEVFEEALGKILELTGEEIVKFLQDILDALFDTFTLYSDKEHKDLGLIFKVLVHIFLLLDEPRYQHFRPVLDSYASAHFSATLVHEGLLACVNKCLEQSSEIDKQVPIKKCFRSIKYIFQFIVQSRLLLSEATGNSDDKLFLKDLEYLFKQFEHMLSEKDPKLIPVQETFLEFFPGTLEELIRVLTPLELAILATNLAKRVGFYLPPSLSRAKLIFMKGVANSSLLANQEVRLLIAEKFCEHLEFYIKGSTELDLCYEVLEILLIKVHDYHWPSIYRMYQLTAQSHHSQSSQPGETQPLYAYDVMTVGEINCINQVTKIQVNKLDKAISNLANELDPFIKLMEPLLALLERLHSPLGNIRSLVQKYCAILLTILKLMGTKSFNEFMERREMDYPKLCDIFGTFRAVYNPEWSIMQLTSHAILEHPIRRISKDLRAKGDTRNKGELHQVNKQLASYIKLIVDFITHPTLQLETFSDRKKAYVLGKFGDLRLKFSIQLISFWNELSRANIYDLINASIRPFLDAALLPNDDLQRKLIPVFYDMMDAEDHFKSNSRQIELCLMDDLDLFLNLNRFNDIFVNNFESILKNLIEERKPGWKIWGLQLIGSLARLIKLLTNYRLSIDISENKNRQMSYLVELLNYYKNQDRMDLHLKYLFKLRDMHLELGNHVEAAFTLKMYTDEIRWMSHNLNPLEGYRPEEQEWRRKEVLYHEIIHLFDKAECWEESKALCKELGNFYENFLVDYRKYSDSLKSQAEFLDRILDKHRAEREYFRVEFIGTNVTDYFKGKEFIYRGYEYERLPAFMQRMNMEFPDAEILNSKSKQQVTKDTPGLFLIISNVKPVPSLQGNHNPGQRNIDDRVIQYYLNNRLDTFSYDIPIIKTPTTVANNNCTLSGGQPKDKADELNVRNLWVGRYILKIRNQLPYILPWAEIISQDYIEISPINHAIETISSMNFELTKLILSYKSEPNKQVSPLTMRLQGVIEASVNGGPSVFVNAFLKRQPGAGSLGQELELNRQSVESQESLTKLADLIKQQFSILDTGIALHAKLMPPEVKPLHDRLVERLQSTKKMLIDEINQAPEDHYVLYPTRPAETGVALSGGANGLPVAASPSQQHISASSSSSGTSSTAPNTKVWAIYKEVKSACRVETNNM